MTPEETSSWEPFLKTIPLFSGLSSADIARVAARMQALSLPKGATVYSQGEEPNAFYIITSGQVRVVRAVGSVETVDAFLGRGETLGEGGLMTGEPRHNTARLDTTCELLKLRRQDFEEVLRENPSILLHLSRILARRIVRAQDPSPGAPAQLITLNAVLTGAQRRLLSVHLALQLAAQSRRRVLLADLTGDAGALARTLGLKAAPDAGPDMEGAHLRDPSWVRSLILRHPSGLDVLSLPAAALAGRLYSSIYHFLNFLREDHDIVLVCLKDALGDVERSIIAEADQALLAGCDAERCALRLGAAQLRSLLPETGGILELRLGSPPRPEDALEAGHELIALPWTDALDERFERTGSPFEAVEGHPKSLRAVERLARRLAGVRLGVALGAGAALGHSLIGMLKVFKREHIPVDLVAGTSSGALVGGWLALGMEPEEMEETALRMGKAWLYENLFRDLTIPRSGVFAGETLLRFLRSFYGDKEFSDLELPLACVATDIETGEEVVLREGRVAEAIRASCGLPMVFTPFRWKDRYLVDGGLVDPVPTRIAAEMGADLLVAVNFTLPAGRRSTQRRPKAPGDILTSPLDFSRIKDLALPASLHAPNLFDVFIQMIHTFEYELARSRIEFSHVAIQPDLGDFHWTETHRSREIIKAGELIAEEYVPQIKALLPFFTGTGRVPKRPSSPLRP